MRRRGRMRSKEKGRDEKDSAGRRITGGTDLARGVWLFLLLNVSTERGCTKTRETGSGRQSHEKISPSSNPLTAPRKKLGWSSATKLHMPKSNRRKVEPSEARGSRVPLNHVNAAGRNDQRGTAPQLAKSWKILGAEGHVEN